MSDTQQSIIHHTSSSAQTNNKDYYLTVIKEHFYNKNNGSTINVKPNNFPDLQNRMSSFSNKEHLQLDLQNKLPYLASNQPPMELNAKLIDEIRKQALERSNYYRKKFSIPLFTLENEVSKLS